MDSVNKFSKLNYPVKDTLFVEFHGTDAGVKEQAEMVQSIAAEHGGGEFKWATKTEERNALWTARHDVTYANKALRPGCEIWATDVCVPISRLTECIMETKRDLKESFLIAPLVSVWRSVGSIALTMLIFEKSVGSAAFHMIATGVLWVALGLTIVSAVDYFYRFFRKADYRAIVPDEDRWS